MDILIRLKDDDNKEVETRYFDSSFLDGFPVTNSPFRLTSLIYAEKFELKNPAIMEDKQCKQTERFPVMTKGRYYVLS